MRATILFGVSLGVATLCMPAVARSARPSGEIHTRIQGIRIPAVPNAPFTARVVVTWDQPVTSGGTLSRKYYTMVARDSKGRVHRETRGFVPADSAAEPPIQSQTILDPVAGVETVCRQSSMICTQSAFTPRPMLSPASGAGGNGKSASLGTRTMQGLSVQGTSKTTAAADGSKTMQTESWYSPDLGIDMFVVRRSAQTGTVTINVKDLKRGEPAREMFAIPSGYQLVKARGGR
jgi:hypothetical protein